MAFKDYPGQTQGIELLQRSLQRGRLAHAYLFIGGQLDELQGLALNLAKTLNCRQPVLKEGVAIDCCDHCPSCQKSSMPTTPMCIGCALNPNPGSSPST